MSAFSTKYHSRTLHDIVTRAESICDILESFLPEHEDALNESRRNSMLTIVESLDIAATIASFRLFFMVMQRQTEDKKRQIYCNNAALIHAVYTDAFYGDLSPKQRILALLAAGMHLSYGFVWH